MHAETEMEVLRHHLPEPGSEAGAPSSRSWIFLLPGASPVGMSCQDPGVPWVFSGAKNKISQRRKKNLIKPKSCLCEAPS